MRRPARTNADGGGASRPGPRRHHLLFAEGLHPADPSLPGLLPLLHLRPAAAPRRALLPVAERGAGDRRSRPSRRLPRGAVHPRRQARAPLPRRPGGARRARPRDHARLSRGDGGPRLRRDRAAAAPQSRRHDERRHPPPPAGLGLDGPHARDRLGAPRRTGRPAFRLARQGPRRAARHHRRGRDAPPCPSPRAF